MKPQFKWALAAAAVLLLGFVSLQQTGALWRSDANNGTAGTITAGTLDISAGLDGFKSFDMDKLALDDANAGDSVQKALPVINSGNVTMSYKLNSVAVTGQTPLMLRVAVVPNVDACTETGNAGTQLYQGPMQTAFTNARNVAAGTTEVLCLRATITDDAQPGQQASAAFTFGAESVARA
ncbi:hypothetical protein [Gordonia sp. (in: high G+C Gram-positive bacteria)]|uniref:hypothetical protein n=1 Tax=Gordonia sp. (in: high G+C Gram-positive bacteria) TaxID=84139 RepID=UPI003C746BCE